MAIKGSRGGRRHRHIPPALTMEQVAALRAKRAQRPPVPYKLLAREYGLASTTLQNAVHGRKAYAEPDVVKDMRLIKMHLDEALLELTAARLRVDRLKAELDKAKARLAKAGWAAYVGQSYGGSA